MDSPPQRLAALEPVSKVQWARCRRPDTKMVVGRQQLEYTKGKIQAEGYQVGKKRV